MKKNLRISSLYGVEGLRGSSNEHNWESLNNDPQIYFNENFSNGFYRFVWQGESKETRYIRLYKNFGDGFSQENSVLLGSINERGGQHFKVVKFEKNITQLRLDPGDSPGQFVLGDISIEKISSVSYFKLVFEGYSKLYGRDGVLKLFQKGFRKWRENGFKWIFNKAESFILNHSSDAEVQYSFVPYKFIDNDVIDTKDLKSNIFYTIIIPFQSRNAEFLYRCLDSLKKQSYKNHEIILVGRKLEDLDYNFNGLNVKYVEFSSADFMDYIKAARPEISGDYVIVVEEEDFLSINSLYYSTMLIEQENSDLLYMDEDRFIDNEHFSPFYKSDFILNDIKNKVEFIGPLLVKGNIFESYCNETLYSIFKGKIISNSKIITHIPQILYHKRATASQWNESNPHKIKMIPFYLPQYHEIPENNEWWGEGFTEWTNVKKATPLYEGHYQPHVPADLGYYNLVEEEDINEKQIKLARENDIFGFCYYYYWFDGKRLLEKPLNILLENKELDFPFCICWANESWSRRWDGQEKELLMQQIHDEDSDKRFIEEIIPMLKDKRYICIEDEVPIILIYRAELFPNLKNTILSWKEKCRENGIKDLHVCMVQSFGQQDPEVYGCDSAVEFPPHGIYASEISGQIKGLNQEFNGNIYDYKEVVERTLQKRNSAEYTWFRGAMLSWDNTARRKVSSNIFYNSSPEEYEKWLIGLVDYTRKFNSEENQLIFINAWNEWAEGTHLEPDQKYGHAYLKATQRALNVR